MESKLCGPSDSLRHSSISLSSDHVFSGTKLASLEFKITEKYLFTVLWHPRGVKKAVSCCSSSDPVFSRIEDAALGFKPTDK